MLLIFVTATIPQWIRMSLHCFSGFGGMIDLTSRKLPYERSYGATYEEHAEGEGQDTSRYSVVIRALTSIQLLQASSQMSSPWLEAIDPASGEVYYYHKETQE